VSVIKPFRALRPSSAELARPVSSIPYDVCSRDELHSLVENNPLSFLRVTRAEAEISGEIHSENQAVFELAKKNLQRFIDDKVLTLETEPSLYIYRLSIDSQTQTGVVACCPLAEYENDLIKKHEKVRPDKVQDRTRHMVTLRAQTGLIFLAFRGTRRIADLIDEAVKTEPVYDFVSSGEVQNTVWRVSANIEEFVQAFAEVPALYVADGHHRLEAANLTRRILRSVNQSVVQMQDLSDLEAERNEEYNYVIAGMFPDTDLRIMPYNRIVRDLNNLSEEEFWQRLKENFTVSETDDAKPEKRGEICVYLGGKWRKIHLGTTANSSDEENPHHALDVSILQEHILEPILGIEDIQTDKRIEFIGGIRGTDELERLVDAGKAKIAFSMYPTSIEDLFEVSDAGGIMPPKSTWFEPKLRDGLLIHLI
jgi:uncharacterized protein (DUF1015 family)